MNRIHAKLCELINAVHFRSVGLRLYVSKSKEYVSKAVSMLHSYIHSKDLAQRNLKSWPIKHIFAACQNTVCSASVLQRLSSMMQFESVILRTTHVKHCLKTKDFNKKVPLLRRLHVPDSHEKGSETRAPDNHHLLSFTCQINCASPAVEMAAPSEAAGMRCSFMTWQRNLFFYLPPN